MTYSESLLAQRRTHAEVDPHVRGRWLPDIVLGAQDGAVNTLGVVLGVASATAEIRVIVAAGFAAAFAESISMAAVAYTTARARGDLYRAEREREYRHIRRTPDVEREEIRELLSRRGLDGDVLERAVERICATPDTWVEFMMAEEHGLVPVDRRASARSAVLVGVSSVIASTLPVMPFVLLDRGPGVVASLASGTLILGGLGAFEAGVTTGSVLRGALRLVIIGLLSALTAFAIGSALS